MKEQKQNENCIDSVRTFTTENNVIAIPPSLLLPDIQSLGKKKDSLCNNHPELIHSSAAGTAQEHSLRVKKKNLRKQQKKPTTKKPFSFVNTNTAAIFKVHSSLHYHVSTRQRMTIKYSVNMHKYCLLHFTPSAFIITNDQIHSLAHVDYISSLLCNLMLIVTALLYEKILFFCFFFAF